MFVKTYQWQDPIKIAHTLSEQEQDMAFLYSSKKYPYSGDHSFLAWGIDKETTNIKDLEKFLKTPSNDPYENFWLGYLGYESLSKSNTTQKTNNLPKLFFFKPKNLLVFDHKKFSVNYYSKTTKTSQNSKTDSLLSNTYNPSKQPSCYNKLGKAGDTHRLTKIKSNMRKEEYIKKVEEIRKSIIEGDYYQANLTRKFYGEISVQNPFEIFNSLSLISPAPYSAYIKFRGNHILSSSPERFIKIDKDGNINARPIKGTINRSSDNGEDANINILRNSTKDRAENLMIVDLMRNDLGKSANSVNLDKLFHIDSFATLHHMSSSINASKKPDISNLSAVTNAFPPGSMTGTPKIAAIKALEKLEEYDRGVYSGCLGYFAGNQSCDLSVVIRTIIISPQAQNKPHKFEFQVGGAIIYDSDPQKEWQETLIKAKGICQALNLNPSTLASL